MLHHIHANNVSAALAGGLLYLREHGVAEDSRNGKVLVAPGPVVTTYQHPKERVLFSPVRDANPWLHVMESLWMLAGRNDVGFLTYFTKRFAEYSDDGATLHGAYGFRWLEHFGFSQLDAVIHELTVNPQSRRAVLAMWDPEVDTAMYGIGGATGRTGKDYPCNTHIYFDLRGGGLNMTVCCRSNDLWWGAHGANAVHFSFLLEYMAARLNAPVGLYRQFSNNYHLYDWAVPHDKIYSTAIDIVANQGYREPYGSTRLYGGTVPLMTTNERTWREDLETFLEDPDGDQKYTEPFFETVAAPMFVAWRQRKDKDGDGRVAAAHIAAPDWRRACLEWIDRREARAAQKSMENDK